MTLGLRQYLQTELVRRVQKNPRYSIRAFARLLDVSPSTLSQFLRNKRKLSEKAQLRLAVKLGLGPSEASQLLEKRTGNTIGRPEVKDLSLDAFQVIADWYHYGIYELVLLKQFKPDAKWIAKTLGITVSETHAAIERLERLELLVKTESGSWKQGTPLVTTIGNDFTAAAFRKIQSQVLQMALDALEHVRLDRRDQSSMTLAMNTRRMPEVKERIKSFRREMSHFLEQDHDRDAVYQLGVSFYPLTKFTEKKEAHS